MEEIWKPVIGYEGLYEVSSLGRVKSLNYNGTKQERIMKLKKERCYSRIGLSKNKIVTYLSVSRLVGIHFIPNPLNLPCVLHKAEDLDERGLLYNGEDNLWWGNHSDNSKDRENKGRGNDLFKKNNPLKGLSGKTHPRSKPIMQYSFNRELIREFESITEASRILGITASSITTCCDKQWRTAGGFRWKSK